MVMKRFEIIEKLYLSKALLKMAGGGCIPPHPPPGSVPEFDDFFEIKITSKFFNFQVPVKKEWLKNSWSEFF